MSVSHGTFEPGFSSLEADDVVRRCLGARRGCTFSSFGAGSCAAGDSGGGLEPTDNTAGEANYIEMNLNGAGLDYWGGSHP